MKRIIGLSILLFIFLSILVGYFVFILWVSGLKSALLIYGIMAVFFSLVALGSYLADG